MMWLTMIPRSCSLFCLLHFCPSWLSPTALAETLPANVRVLCCQVGWIVPIYILSFSNTQRNGVSHYTSQKPKISGEASFNRIPFKYINKIVWGWSADVIPRLWSHWSKLQVALHHFYQSSFDRLRSEKKGALMNSRHKWRAKFCDTPYFYQLGVFCNPGYTL